MDLALVMVLLLELLLVWCMAFLNLEGIRSWLLRSLVDGALT